jgi:hypothetical protein
MKYLCLIYADESLWPKMPKPEADKMLAEYYEFGEGIKKSGHYLGGNRLQPVQAATTVRVRNGKMSTTAARWLLNEGYSASSGELLTR